MNHLPALRSRRFDRTLRALLGLLCWQCERGTLVEFHEPCCSVPSSFHLWRNNGIVCGFVVTEAEKDGKDDWQLFDVQISDDIEWPLRHWGCGSRRRCCELLRCRAVHRRDAAVAGHCQPCEILLVVWRIGKRRRRDVVARVVVVVEVASTLDPIPLAVAASTRRRCRGKRRRSWCCQGIAGDTLRVDGSSVVSRWTSNGAARREDRVKK